MVQAEINTTLRQLPSVDALLKESTAMSMVTQYGRPATVDALRKALDAARARLMAGDTVPIHNRAILAEASSHLSTNFRPTLRPVINATGVIIHTNLGRALLSRSAQKALLKAAENYTTLEYDLDTGERGSRYTHAESLLCELTGAEAALVVNNNAASLILILSALARDKGVVISRGQLVEIGGGFRVPEIMQQSGAKLIEVGTTNRTRAADYEQAITEETAMLLRVHASNFKIVGFTEETPLADMAKIARERKLLLVDDLGSGTLLDTSKYGLDREPMVQDSIAAGADLICFSGDKLLGGPQAGIIVGKKDHIANLKQNPLARALRADKLCYAALNATLEHYRKNEATDHIPVWQMIARPLETLQETAYSWSQQVGGTVINGESAVGGGSLPGATLPTALLALDVSSPDAIMARLREAEMPVIARIQDNRVVFDPRTVLRQQESALLAAIRTVVSN